MAVRHQGLLFSRSSSSIKASFSFPGLDIPSETVERPKHSREKSTQPNRQHRGSNQWWCRFPQSDFCNSRSWKDKCHGIFNSSSAPPKTTRDHMDFVPPNIPSSTLQYIT